MNMKTTATIIRDDIEGNGWNETTRMRLADLAARRRVNFRACLAYAEHYDTLRAADRLATPEAAEVLSGIADQISGEEWTRRENDR